MKRSNEDVIGRPRLANLRSDVAGARLPSPILEVASFRHAFDDPMGTAREEAQLLADFADFMTGDAQFESGELPLPNPVFRERLRRRLWRTHLMTHLRDGGETH